MELLTPGIGLIFWTILVFVILYFALKKFAWKPILQTVKEREAGIADTIEAAQKMKQEMARMKSENETFLAQARSEREQMIKEANETGAHIIMEAKEEARLKCSRMVEGAIMAIRQQKELAMAEALKQVDSLAVEASEKLLRRKLALELDE